MINQRAIYLHVGHGDCISSFRLAALPMVGTPTGGKRVTVPGRTFIQLESAESFGFPAPTCFPCWSTGGGSAAKKLEQHIRRLFNFIEIPNSGNVFPLWIVANSLLALEAQ